MVTGVGGAAARIVPSGRAVSASSVSASPSAAAKVATTTRVGEMDSDRMYYLDGVVNAVMDRQAQALLRQDEEGFLAPAKTDQPRSQLALRYRNLSAMHISRLHFVTSLTATNTAGQWNGLTTVYFCFLTPDCIEDQIDEATVWTDKEDGPELLSVDRPEKSRGAQPWEVSELAVAVGQRVIVATTASLKGRLNELLQAAESAIPVADSFATTGTRPDIYRMYLAGPAEWKTWYGGGQAKWVAGYDVWIGRTHSDVVLNNANYRSRDLPDMLRHELTHVSTLIGYRYFWKGNWWLIEGIAELAAHPETLDAEHWRAATHSYVHGRWNGTLPGDGPDDNASDSDVGAQYGIAFLAMQRLDQRFGHDRALLFFRDVVNNGQSAEEAAPAELGASWSDVQHDCVAYVRSAV